MLKKAVKAIRRLGSNTKLQEHDGRAADAPAAAPPAPQLPPGLPRPPTPSAAVQAAPASQQQQRQQQMAPAAAAPHAAAAAEGGGRPASSPQPAAAPSPREQHQPLGMPGEPLVDYELVAGPLELDTAEEDAAGLADPAAEAAAEAAAAAQLAACSLDHQQLPPGGGEVCYDACGEAGALGAEEAAAAAAAAAVAALEAGGHGGGPAHEGAGPSGSGAAEGGAGSGGGGAGGGVEGISDALAAMMYLTEDAEGGDDCVSVVSGARACLACAPPLRSRRQPTPHPPALATRLPAPASRQPCARNLTGSATISLLMQTRCRTTRTCRTTSRS